MRYSVNICVDHDEILNGYLEETGLIEKCARSKGDGFDYWTCEITDPKISAEEATTIVTMFCSLGGSVADGYEERPLRDGDISFFVHLKQFLL